MIGVRKPQRKNKNQQQENKKQWQLELEENYGTKNQNNGQNNAQMTQNKQNDNNNNSQQVDNKKENSKQVNTKDIQNKNGDSQKNLENQINEKNNDNQNQSQQQNKEEENINNNDQEQQEIEDLNIEEIQNDDDESQNSVDLEEQRKKNEEQEAEFQKKFEKKKKYDWLDSDDENFSVSSEEDPEEKLARQKEIEELEKQKEALKIPDVLEDKDIRTVFVQNLNFELQDAEILKFFTSFGRILGSEIPRNEGGMFNKGRAFIEYVTSTEARKAIQEGAGKVLKNRAIDVSLGLTQQTMNLANKKYNQNQKYVDSRFQKFKNKSRSRSRSRDRDRKHKKHRR
ncbi:hypothetical protein PPERSA_05538 [Pseudocohnilembus persalinus]|uniref:RRM domain-containing protein n=1 Tax=Pseudocohnilembus persalinus TaxID=266149 RepID=A0A0V0QU46_PSEPJ|nr:hypothetical protein PPERSA_05538 [Pseudocohnilembus persalinus]|eukprot:KRX05429.1 hypothetical protein PPERSA_05538 [Pseudocohnilembus persalinus]